MPDVLGEPPSPRTALFWNGTAWQWALVDTAGRLQVRGEDQLFSMKGVLTSLKAGVISGAGGYYESDTPPAGEYWVVTGIAAADNTSPTTAHTYYLHHGADIAMFYDQLQAFATFQPSSWSGHAYLGPGDVIRAGFIGALAADACMVHLIGYIMTLET